MYALYGNIDVGGKSLVLLLIICLDYQNRGSNVPTFIIRGSGQEVADIVSRRNCTIIFKWLTTFFFFFFNVLFKHL